MRKLALISILVLTFLVVSCGPGETTNKPNMAVPFIGGNVALEMSLQQGMPPALVQDGGRSEFGFGLVLNNVGESDIGPGSDNEFLQVALEGFKPEEFGMTGADMVQEIVDPLRGAHKNFDGTVIPGDLLSVIFQPMTYTQRLAGGNRLKTIRANVCYDYTNYATAQVCFKDDVIENAADSTICTLTGEKGPQNSGGPLQITSLVENPLNEYKIQISFVLEHVGTGDFYARPSFDGYNSNFDDCDPDVRNTNRFKAYVEINSEDQDLDISCSRFGGDNAGVVTMFPAGSTTGAAGTQLITCTLETQGDGVRVFEDNLDFKISYRYGEFIEQPITIQALGNN